MLILVARINSLLARFDTVNTEIVKGELAGIDVTDYLDTRDQIVNDLSTEVGIRTVVRPGNDMAISTDSGVALYDRGARTVTFRGRNLAPGVAGAAVFIDGVQVTGSSATMPVTSGQ